MTWPKNPKAPSIKEAKQRRDKIMDSPEYLGIGEFHGSEKQTEAVKLCEQLAGIILGQRKWLD